ncbi:hypothetical protein [Trichothermofontia sp.]
MSFVGYRQVDSGETLRDLIDQCVAQIPSYYFLRWAHQVSGMIADLPEDFPSPEGQVFNAKMELRWKRQGQGYSVLLLSNSAAPVDGFTPSPGDWETRDRLVRCHDSKETQYPKGFYFDQGVNPNYIRQRYFRDRRTATVHFVALTLVN